MDEYAALAQRVALTMGDVRGCLVLSRDGLVLGAFPEESEAAMKPAWLRFVNVGDARRSFVEFGDQIWAYIFRGPYAAFVVSGTSVRPGVLLDQLEVALLTAEEARQKRDTLRVPEAPGAPSGKPRTSLHPPVTDRPAADLTAGPPANTFGAFTTALGARPPAGEAPAGPTAGGPPEEHVRAGGEAAPIEAKEPEPFRPSPFADLESVSAPADPAPAGAGEEPAPEPTAVSSFPRSLQRLAGAPGTPDAPEPDTPEEGGEIDRVLLAKEFGGLLQTDSDADEASS